VVIEKPAPHHLQFASIGTWFLAAYTISQGLSGHLYTIAGELAKPSPCRWQCGRWRRCRRRSREDWLASASLRFALGLGEAGNWPGAAKVVGEWFPPKERAFGMAIFNSGAAIGSVIAPPLIIWLQITYSWRAAFLVTGCLGFLWIALWLAVYRACACGCGRCERSHGEHSLVGPAASP